MWRKAYVMNEQLGDYWLNIYFCMWRMDKIADEQINGIYYVLRKWKYIMSTC